jgi:hypothetical protein
MRQQARRQVEELRIRILQVRGIRRQIDSFRVEAVDPGADRRPVSPLVFGVNFASPATVLRMRYTANRWGGNATSRYSWVDDTSNRRLNEQVRAGRRPSMMATRFERYVGRGSSHLAGRLADVHVQPRDAVGVVVVEHQPGALLVGVEEGQFARARRATCSKLCADT